MCGIKTLDAKNVQQGQGIYVGRLKRCKIAIAILHLCFFIRKKSRPTQNKIPKSDANALPIPRTEFGQISEQNTAKSPNETCPNYRIPKKYFHFFD